MVDPLDRLTHGVNLVRLKIEGRRALPAIPTLVLAALATFAGGALLFSQLTPTLFKSTRVVRFAVDDAYGVTPGVNDVRYRGVPAGAIKTIDRDGTQVVLEVSLRKDFPVYADVRAVLRPETPLEDMYLDVVDPGTKGAGKLSGTVPAARTDTSVNIDDVLNTLRSDERTRLSQLLDNLGNGMAGGGDGLRRTVNAFTPFLADAGVITDQVARRKAMTQRLISNAALLTSELGKREEQVRHLVRDGSATLGTLSEGSSDLDATLREIPPSLRSVNASFGALRGVLEDVDQAVTDLDPVADRLPSALGDVRTLNKALAPAVDELQTPVRRLVPFAATLRPVAGDLDVTAQALRPQAGSLNTITKDLVSCEKAVIHFFQWNSSLSKFGDVRGPIPRGNLAAQAPGAAKTDRKPLETNCAGGTTIGGRPASAEDAG